MISNKRVMEFVEWVKAGRYIEALEEFYADDATAQDNLNSPRVGRAALVQHELQTLARVKQMRTHAVGPVLIDGDRVVIRWVFAFVLPDNHAQRLDELALQEWRGDRIVKEQFYFDSAQLAANH
jgi:hypothetical protein